MQFDAIRRLPIARVIRSMTCDKKRAARPLPGSKRLAGDTRALLERAHPSQPATSPQGVCQAELVKRRRESLLTTGNTRARPFPHEGGSALPKDGFVRLNGVIAPDGPIPVSKSTWWAGVRRRYPKPVKLGPRITAWRVEDIRD